MSQNDFTIANQGFPAFRADINSALQALASNNSGATEPSTMFSNMWWYDSSNNIMYIRNEDNDAWIKFAELDQANDKFVLSGTLQLDDGTVSAPALTFNSDTNMGIYRGGTDILKFVTAGTDAITIASNQSTTLAGNLNVSKVNANTVLDGTTGYSLLKIKADSTLRIDFGTSADDDAGRIQYDAPTNNFRFYTNNTRVVDIDNSGNLLVGTTDNTPYNNTTADDGVAISGSGWIATSRNNNASGLFNLTGDDGDIISFRKDGSAVGSIGTASGFLYAGHDDVGLIFRSNESIRPYNPSTTSERDAQIDLGVGAVRFKNLYLSGDIYLGDGHFIGDQTNDNLLIKSSGGENIEYNSGNGTHIFYNNGVEKFRIDNNDNVGIGTSSPSYQLHVSRFGSQFGTFETTSTTADVGINLVDGNSNSYTMGFDYSSGLLKLVRGTMSSTTGLSIDSSGNLLVGTTGGTLPESGTTSAHVGVSLDASNYVASARYQNIAGYFNRIGNDGDIISFRKDGTTVGNIGNTSGQSYFYIANDGGCGIAFGNANAFPANGTGSLIDNAKDLGGGATRWDDVYATNGTIQTSDRNEKQDIEELSDAEQRVAVVAKGLMRKFRWINSVAEKGDNARTHFGIIAQDLQDALTAEGLDASDYAMFTSNTWWELDGETYETEEEAPEGATENTRLGVRYSELLAFIISAI